MEPVTFRIIDIDIEQIQDTEMVIHISGLTQDGKTVYVKVLGYQPYCFLELPMTDGTKPINWNGPKIEAVKEYIRSRLQECPPDVMKFEIKKLALYSVTRPILRINFKTDESWKRLKWMCSYPWAIQGFSKKFEANAFRLHEHNIASIVKFGIERSIEMSGWITVKPIKTDRLAKFSRCDYSIYTKPSFVSKAKDISADLLVDPKICSFDIELHSLNRKSSSPKPQVPENVITMVSLVFGRLSQPLEEWESYVITLYPGNKPPSGKYKATVIDCKGSERNLLIQFTKLVHRNMPDIMTGYNIIGFDWSCFLTRAEIVDGEQYHPTSWQYAAQEETKGKKKPACDYGPIYNRFFKMGKLIHEPGKLVDLSWESSARGKQEIKYVKSTGVFNFDVFPDVKCNHSLTMYKLAFVAEHFLKKSGGTEEKKEDMPYQQMFAIFDMVEVLERSISSDTKEGSVEPKSMVKMTPELAKKLILSKVSPEELLEIDGMTNHVAEFYAELKKTKTLEQIVDVARSFMLRLLKYVIQDARLCPALMLRLNSLVSLWETSNITKCPPSFVYDKGQQVKVLAQYATRSYNSNYVIPFYNKPKEKLSLDDDDDDDDDKKNYQGATVLKVKKGLYKNITVLDFAALYPSIMMSRNICHSTILAPDDPTPDSECNVAKWSEHVRCEHDPEQRKKKKGEKIYCGDHFYRFRKHDEKPEKKGILPLLLETLTNARNAVKKTLKVEETKWKEMKKRESTLTEAEVQEMRNVNIKASILNARQLALKVSSNSSYGFLGALKGYFPLIEGAATVTYYGREAIQKAITLTESKWPQCEVIYGDSVVGDTPLLLKDPVTRIVYIKTIDDLAKDGVKSKDYTDYSGFKPLERGLSQKQQSQALAPSGQPFLSWTDVGWVPVKRVIRHKCGKEIFRVQSRFGCVDVTEDHSLLDVNCVEIKPGELKVGKTRLLYAVPPMTSGPVYVGDSRDKSLALYQLYISRRERLSVKCVGNEYVFEPTDNYDNPVFSIIPLGKTDDFVYDLETECGRFHAGVGFNIVKNTDSIFVDFHTDDLKVIFSLGHEAEKYITSHFPPGMRIEMEKVCGWLFLRQKKKYSYALIDEDGVVLKKESKGDMNKRRDNCDAAREVYSLAEKSITDFLPQEETLYRINEAILNIYRGLVPLRKFVIYRGLNKVIEEYKKCQGHVLFAKRLEDRGNTMNAGTRLEYVFIKRPGQIKSGELMEDWSYFLMNRKREKLRLDYGYYIEHNIMKPTTESLNIAYPAPERQFYKPEDSFKRAMDIYLPIKWGIALKSLSLEKKALYIGKHSKKKVLREAARRFYAKSILDRLYRQHKLALRRTHRPKIGSSVIFLNDRVIQQICSTHEYWADVLVQINERKGLSEWVEEKWSR